MKKFLINNLNFLVGKRNTITQLVLKKINEKKGFILLPTSLNDLASIDENKKLREIYQKVDFCVTDGMSLVWFFNFKSLFKREKGMAERIYGPDLMKNILEFGDINVSHFFYGSSWQTLSNLENYLKKLSPNIKIVKMISPPFRKLTLIEEATYIIKIIKSRADVLWIGLSSPKQVELAARWSHFLPNMKIMCVGAAFDFLARRQVMAPKIIQKLGLEWLFRLIMNPVRLWRRYLISIPGYILKKIYFFFFS
ncbi:MAG: hypothetical protein AUJ41_04100 [Candidatus Pacebacteria bacterium CG1_02_43_31]|nr:WecB/TagA/CpsF family glycosyltransferase [Candidatus Pacearchaeota archaeon]NCQ65569.1 WecB/TagA/CpsF family glycosyltransferase [Candidatus Paceibacterota bacterium]OIO43798.1 MAG: hypothetical protein AUJ41_04100 [Candidatus Pacebacteria bacterium CG1_02_43_31]PIQ80715.1 MAG: hypothetical protein COV78_03940 [Candidatus Pacebacteria bacterium CG11_big_fil_rev_8_21_14_0_20_34_55]PJC43401.1 MAG: hypothetical protein CO039_04140 [Candidatus Pacebacteria bacterium CG_4_9_14_0_2_um_filter_34_5